MTSSASRRRPGHSDERAAAAAARCRGIGLIDGATAITDHLGHIVGGVPASGSPLKSSGRPLHRYGRLRVKPELEGRSRLFRWLDRLRRLARSWRLNRPERLDRLRLLLRLGSRGRRHLHDSSRALTTKDRPQRHHDLLSIV
jgi:hypothetical protein